MVECGHLSSTGQWFKSCLGAQLIQKLVPGATGKRLSSGRFDPRETSSFVCRVILASYSKISVTSNEFFFQNCKLLFIQGHIGSLVVAKIVRNL